MISHDDEVAGPALAAALAGEVGYIGALGSRRTQQSRADWLAYRGITDLEPRPRPGRSGHRCQHPGRRSPCRSSPRRWPCQGRRRRAAARAPGLHPTSQRVLSRRSKRRLNLLSHCEPGRPSWSRSNAAGEDAGHDHQPMRRSTCCARCGRRTGQTGPELDEDCGPTKSCRNMKDVSFDGMAEPGTDLREAWRDRLRREGKLSTAGGSHPRSRARARDDRRADDRRPPVTSHAGDEERLDGPSGERG